MVQTASLFSQLLREIPRNEFARLVNKHHGERHAKGFTCWAQFTAMLFCQLAHADSLREICNGLACCVGKLVHLGITRGPSKSNLSYANVHRPAAVFEDLFWTMTDRFRAQRHLGSRTHMFRFKNKLLSLDSTTISSVSSARLRTRCASRFGQPCSSCSCSSGFTTCRKRGGRSPILPPCCDSTSLPTATYATGLTTHSTHRQ